MKYSTSIKILCDENPIILEMPQKQFESLSNYLEYNPRINHEAFFPSIILQYWEERNIKRNFFSPEEENRQNDDGVPYRLTGSWKLNVNAIYSKIDIDGVTDLIYNGKPEKVDFNENIEILKIKKVCLSLTYFQFEILK